MTNGRKAWTLEQINSWPESQPHTQMLGGARCCHGAGPTSRRRRQRGQLATFHSNFLLCCFPSPFPVLRLHGWVSGASSSSLFEKHGVRGVELVFGHRHPCRQHPDQAALRRFPAPSPSSNGVVPPSTARPGPSSCCGHADRPPPSAVIRAPTRCRRPNAGKPIRRCSTGPSRGLKIGISTPGRPRTPT